MAVTHYYANPHHVNKDEAVWQLGPKAVDGTRLDGIAQMMIETLRQIDVLDGLTQLASGFIVRYPGAICCTPPSPAQSKWLCWWAVMKP